LCRSAGLPPECLDQGLELDIGRLKSCELLGIVERDCGISLIAIEPDKRRESVGVVRMPRQVFLERLDRIGAVPA